jgi:hypothetical protein
MIGVCSNTLSTQEQTSSGINKLLCFILSIFSIAGAIVIAGAEVETGRSGAEFGLLKILLE